MQVFTGIINIQNVYVFLSVPGSNCSRPQIKLKNVCVFCQQPTSPTTPTKPVVPLEWASGVMPKPDPTVINKHIRKLVEVSD